MFNPEFTGIWSLRIKHASMHKCQRNNKYEYIVGNMNGSSIHCPLLIESIWIREEYATYTG